MWFQVFRFFSLRLALHAVMRAAARMSCKPHDLLLGTRRCDFAVRLDAVDSSDWVCAWQRAG